MIIFEEDMITKKNVKLVKLKKRKNSEGNLCFKIPVRKKFARLWIFILVVTFAALICGAAFFVSNSYALFNSFLILLFVFFIWWLDIPARENKVFISKAVYEIMGKFVDEDAYREEAGLLFNMIYSETFLK